MLHDIWDTFTTRLNFFAQLTAEHLIISAISIILASIIGLILGIVISEKQKFSGPVLGLVNFIYTIPSISLLGILIPFSGIGNTTAIIALTVYALLPMVRNTYTGISNINPKMIEAAQGMGSTKFQILRRIKLPLAMPVIISGFRNMVTMTIALAGIASFIGAGGLGVAIYRGITTNNTALTVVGSLLIAILAIVLDIIFGLIEKMVTGKKKKRNKKPIIIICIVLIAALLFGIFMMNRNDNDIEVATKPVTEQFILGEMIKLLVEEDTDLKVNLTHGIGGGTSNIHPAMEKGEFDLYPEYTGTAWNQVIKKKNVYDESMFDELEKEYQDMGISWVGMYGFNNDYGLAVRREIAEQRNFETYSDLAQDDSDLTFGAEYDFYEIEAGFQPLSEEYGFDFKKTVDLDIGLKYQAIESDEIDVMNIFTTDGQLAGANLVVLKDDKDFYPSYRCGNVIRNETLKKFPELRSVLMKFENILDNDEMIRLNNLVDEQDQKPKDVAREFLQDKGLI